MKFAAPLQGTQSYHSAVSQQSTQPFSEVSQPGADWEQSMSFLSRVDASSPSPSSPMDTGLYRLFAGSHTDSCSVSMMTYPDRVLATPLEHGILAVSQSTRSLGCDILAATFHVRLYFSPFQDTFTAVNLSYKGVLIFRSKSRGSRQLAPKATGVLQPGSWSIASQGVEQPQAWLDLLLRPRKSWPTSIPTTKSSGTKRLQDQARDSGKHKKAPNDRHIQTIEPVSNPLLQISTGDTVSMTGPTRNDKYSVAFRNPLSSTRHSRLYTADYSLRPGQIVVVKAFQPAQDDRLLAERWRKEVVAHKIAGQHPCIVRLFGSDARSLTLYMEYIESPSIDKLRTHNMCDCSDKAFVILSDIASAIHFIHASGVVHNDIKPPNIIFHNVRGAILIDFGLAGTTANDNNGATPWYLPPEFLASKRDRRGPLGDVFALGVTMLWVLRKCSLPENQAHWQVADIQGMDAARRCQAEVTMRAWLQKLEELRLSLDEDESSIDHIVRRMLAERGVRSTAKDVIDRLKSVSIE